MSHVDDYDIERNAHRCDYIIEELRQERLYLAVVSYGVFYQRIFVFDMTYFKNRHFQAFFRYISCV